MRHGADVSVDLTFRGKSEIQERYRLGWGEFARAEEGGTHQNQPLEAIAKVSDIGLDPDWSAPLSGFVSGDFSESPFQSAMMS
jgi:hypothetical protein